jgi:hypothetical protein
MGEFDPAYTPAEVRDGTGQVDASKEEVAGELSWNNHASLRPESRNIRWCRQGDVDADAAGSKWGLGSSSQ